MSTSHGSAPVIEDATTDHAADIAAIEAIIAGVETAFNTNDPDLMTADLAENAVVGNAAGALTHGRAEVLASSRAGLRGFLRDEFVRYDVTGVSFPLADMALAHKEARATTADGTPLDTDPAMIALYVLVKREGRWWIVARQNTLVPQGN
ncbi:SgcJ/EcaC family oxidoreductase [Nocardia thailandica]|uniref:SgcJ/EcaC family oxidoreductase n=1 Tax=Nocardia thailandica TaxID=257275 RepID=UPI0005BE92A8|nr:SgcJ/EcaC family oxidoreductase [Nocardia thailandica]